MKIKVAYQTKQMRKLVCTFVVCIGLKIVLFSHNEAYLILMHLLYQFYYLKNN